MNYRYTLNMFNRPVLDKDGEFVKYRDAKRFVNASQKVANYHKKINKNLADENQGLFDDNTGLAMESATLADKMTETRRQKLEILGENRVLQYERDIAVRVSGVISKERRIWARAFIAQTSMTIIIFMVVLILKQ